MQNDVQAFARVYLGYTFTVTKPATWGEWLYDADAQTLTRLSDNLTLQNVTAGGTSLTIGKQYISQSTALDLTGAVTDADGTPYTITALGVEAFWGCGSYLTAITLPDGLESIGRCAFQSCASLTAIEIPSSVTSIGASAFNGCTSLAAVTLPEGLQSIGVAAFWNCSALTSIDIPASVTSICRRAGCQDGDGGKHRQHRGDAGAAHGAGL
ncbi:MAG: leucine-rich repeat domain-containing protein [Ruthenibacterium sp.]|nr:leucine-rich repeat domain-containing protein [Ruthenibacterium sp.]